MKRVLLDDGDGRGSLEDERALKCDDPLGDRVGVSVVDEDGQRMKEEEEELDGEPEVDEGSKERVYRRELPFFLFRTLSSDVCGVASVNLCFYFRVCA